MYSNNFNSKQEQERLVLASDTDVDSDSDAADVFSEEERARIQDGQALVVAAVAVVCALAGTALVMCGGVCSSDNKEEGVTSAAGTEGAAVLEGEGAAVPEGEEAAVSGNESVDTVEKKASVNAVADADEEVLPPQLQGERPSSPFAPIPQVVSQEHVAKCKAQGITVPLKYRMQYRNKIVETMAMPNSFATRAILGFITLGVFIIGVTGVVRNNAAGNDKALNKAGDDAMAAFMIVVPLLIAGISLIYWFMGTNDAWAHHSFHAGMVQPTDIRFGWAWKAVVVVIVLVIGGLKLFSYVNTGLSGAAAPKSFAESGELAQAKSLLMMAFWPILCALWTGIVCFGCSRPDSKERFPLPKMASAVIIAIGAAVLTILQLLFVAGSAAGSSQGAKIASFATGGIMAVALIIVWTSNVYIKRKTGFGAFGKPQPVNFGPYAAA